MAATNPTAPLRRTSAAEAGRSALPSGIEIRGPFVADAEKVLTPGAVAFVAMLGRRFGSRRAALLER
ncbi:MAG: hypothetical protein WAU32_03805, partial [Thermoanaerobaculia bacterium]